MAALALASATALAPRSQAQTFKLLYQFLGTPDGVNPWGGNMVLHQGELYGTTAGGGSSNNGTVFQVDILTRKETVLHSFAGSPSDGSSAVAGLIRGPAGNFYGTTVDGGALGYGTVFQMDPAGAVTILHSFSGADGAYPQAGIVRDLRGNLYGATRQGGTSSSYCPPL